MNKKCILCEIGLTEDNVGSDLNVCVDCMEEMQLDDIFGLN